MFELASAMTTDSATMSSREIAELTGKQHAHVCRDIRSMLETLEKDVSSFGSIFKDAYGRDQQEFRLPKDLTLTLVTGYDVKRRHAVNVRWLELEAQAAKPALDPANLSRLQLIELAMQAEQERLVLEHKVDELTPKAEALDRIADADGTMNPTLAAKALQVQPKKLFDWLREKHWIYRRPGGSGNVAYQDKIQAGYLTHKVTTVQRGDGTEKVVEQVLVTGKGLAKLSQAFGEPVT